MRTLFLLFPILLTACTSETIEVDHYRVPCTGEARFLCMRTREKGQKEYNLEYDSIADFNPEWGHRYTLEIDVSSQIAPADGSSIRKELSSVVSDELVPASTTFDVTIDGKAEIFGFSPDLTFDMNGGGMLRGDVPFKCKNQAACDTAAQTQMNGNNANVTFGYQDPTALPLVLIDAVPL